MSRDDDWDEEQPRRPRDRWGEEDARDRPHHARGPSRSAAVTGAGIVTLILGGLVLLAGVCGGAGIMIAGLEEMNRGGRASEGPLLAALLICLVLLFWGGGAIASGIGLIGRRNWARVLTLILGGFGAIAGLILLLLATLALASSNRGGPQPEAVLGFLLLLFLGLMFLGYCLWTCLILLSSRYAAEFR